MKIQYKDNSGNIKNETFADREAYEQWLKTLRDAEWHNHCSGDGDGTLNRFQIEELIDFTSCKIGERVYGRYPEFSFPVCIDKGESRSLLSWGYEYDGSRWLLNEEIIVALSN